jgi:hypothetical protein
MGLFGNNSADARNQAKHLSVMVADLREMKAELLPNEQDVARKEEMKNFDQFERIKHGLNVQLKELRVEVEKWADLKKENGGERDAAMIKLQSANNKALATAMNEWTNLKAQLVKDQKRKNDKLDEKVLADRNEMVQLLGKEIQRLSEQNATVRVQKTAAELNIEERREKRAQQKREAREQRRKKRGGKNGDAIELDDDLNSPMSQQEQEFQNQVDKNTAEQDQILDLISAGLDELKELSLDMNKNLKLQSAMLEEVDEKMDKTIAQFKSANARLQDILEQTGGVSRWCPMIMCLVILLALVGFIFKLAA